MVRDGADELEVLMLRRSSEVVFSAGAHVFPGGRVDADDHDPDLWSRCVGVTDRGASDRLGVDGGGLAFWVAAVREAFEEVNLLFAAAADGARLAPSPWGEETDGLRRALVTGDRRFVDLCRDHDLLIRADDLHPVSRWITPEGAPRRYDTRFFVAVAPPDVEARADGHEIVDHDWITPAAALDRFAAGEWDLILPTESTLGALSAYESTASLVADLHGGVDFPTQASVDPHTPIASPTASMFSAVGAPPNPAIRGAQ